jgi:hypothetical protein
VSKRSKRQSSFGPTHLFGPPPILPGEDPKAYEEMLNGIVGSIAPRDFVEQIWVHDLTNAAWDLFRWRRMKTAYLAEQADNKASRFAMAQMTALLPEKGEITQFLRSELALIERVEARIMTPQRRFDEIIRELHRHRFMQNQTRKLPAPESTKVEDTQPMIAGTLVTTAPHDE